MENASITSLPNSQKYNNNNLISQFLNSDIILDNTDINLKKNSSNITNLNKSPLFNSTNKLSTNSTNNSSNITILSNIPGKTKDNINVTNKINNKEINRTLPNKTIDKNFNSDIINNNKSINIKNNTTKNIKNKTNTHIPPKITDIIKNYNISLSDISSSFIEEKNIFNINNTIKNHSDNKNITKKISNNTNNKTSKNTANSLLDNIQNLDKKYILGIEILFPALILIMIIIIIIYCCKKRHKSQVAQISNNNFDKNGLKFQSQGNNGPYNRIQNTSGINVGLNPNNLSMSEIKVQNLKDEIHNIITNKSGGSNSSGKRKREKRKMGNNNKINSNSQDNDIGMHNEIKEEIKQYVIDEHLNN